MANDQMFNPMNPMQAALLGPDILQKQYQMEQNRRYADLLQAQSMEPMQGQMVDGHYIAPSPVQGLANMLRSYVSRKTMDDMPQQMAELGKAQKNQIDNMFGVGGGNVPQGDASRMALTGGAMQGSTGPTNDNATRMNNVQAGTGSAFPLPAGMDGRMAATTYLISPAEYAKALVSHSTPTELMKNSNWLGRSQAEVLNAQRGKERADSAITGGNTYWNADGSMGIAPDMKTGTAGGFDSNGNVVAKPILGWGQNNANIKGLEAGSVAGAQAQNKLVKTPTGPNQTDEFKTEAQVINDVTGGKSVPAAPDNKTQNANDIDTYIEQANKLLGNASNGLISSAVTGGKEVFGVSSDSSKADAQLKVISGNLVLKQPRMEGPQSDADRKLYQQMAADVANPLVPIETRQAALLTLKELNNKYLPNNGQKNDSTQNNQPNKNTTPSTPNRSALEAEARKRGLIK